MSYLMIDQVTKRYQQQTVLNKISLSLRQGEFATLLGQSGCGKSTLLRSIAGLVDIDEGAIHVDGKNITNMEPRNREIGMVFQSYALFPNMTVFDNIAFGLKMKKKKNIKNRVQRMIEMMDLIGKEDSYPHQLSGGQQQRVALARSLILEPKVLLLDEPLSALDAKIRRNLQLELKKIQREFQITTIFVTHDQEEAMTMSDTIYIMNEGSIVQSGIPSEIYTSPVNSFVAKFIGNYNVLQMDQFQKMIQTEELAIEGQEVAIRPEVIDLVEITADVSNIEEKWIVQGTVQDVSMIGNVIRYEMNVNGILVKVDYLHSHEHFFKQGENLHLIIPKSECIVF
jgi:putative spermidine/putrescine transport system ATP-binding protein